MQQRKKKQFKGQESQFFFILENDSAQVSGQEDVKSSEIDRLLTKLCQIENFQYGRQENAYFDIAPLFLVRFQCGFQRCTAYKDLHLLIMKGSQIGTPA